MNSLILISPYKGGGLKPILSGNFFSIIIQNLSFILYQFGQVYSKTVHNSIQTLMREFRSASHQKSQKS